MLGAAALLLAFINTMNMVDVPMGTLFAELLLRLVRGLYS